MYIYISNYIYMYILVEIIHTEFQCISLIEIEKELRKEKHEKKRPFVPVGNTNRDKRVRHPRGRWLHLLSRLVLPTGTKGHPLLSRTGVPCWETGTTAVSQPGQINVFVVVVAPQVNHYLTAAFGSHHRREGQALSVD